MLKLVLVGSLLFFMSLRAGGQSKNPCNADSSYYYLYMDSSGLRLNYSKTIFAYNDRKQVVLGTEFFNTKLFTFDSTLWESKSKNTSTYNSQGLLSEYSEQYWNESNNIWENYYKVFYDYNSGLQLASEITQMVDAGQLVNNGRNLTTYGPDGRKLLMQSYYWDIGNNIWNQNGKTDYYYNAQGKPSGAHTLYWDDSDSAWKKYYLDSFNYNSRGQQTEKINFNGILNSWTKSDRDTLFYNAAGLKTELIHQLWSNNEWLNQAREIYTYNDWGCLTLTDYFSDWQNGKWASHTVEEFFYTEREFDGFTIYPNPSISTLFIDAPNETPFSIIDMNGKEVFQGIAKKGTNTLDIQWLSAGVYFVRTKDTVHKLLVL